MDRRRLIRRQSVPLRLHNRTLKPHPALSVDSRADNGAQERNVMNVSKFAIADASFERSPGQNGDVFVSNMVDQRHGGPITIGYGRYGPNQTLGETMVVHDTMIVLEGKLSVRQRRHDGHRRPGRHRLHAQGRAGTHSLSWARRRHRLRDLSALAGAVTQAGRPTRAPVTGSDTRLRWDRPRAIGCCDWSSLRADISRSCPLWQSGGHETASVPLVGTCRVTETTL